MHPTDLSYPTHLKRAVRGTWASPISHAASMETIQSSDEQGKITTTCGRSAVPLQLQVSKLGGSLVTLRLNITVPNLQAREGLGGHGPQPDPTTGEQLSLSISLVLFQNTAIPCKTLAIRYSKYTPMSWAQPDHGIFNSYAIYMMSTQRFTCPFPEKDLFNSHLFVTLLGCVASMRKGNPCRKPSALW